jgi:hypothetical protein
MSKVQNPAKPVAIVAPSVDPHFSPNNPYGQFSPSITRRWKRPVSPVSKEYVPLLKNIGTVFLKGKEIPICPVEGIPRNQLPWVLERIQSETSPIPINIIPIQECDDIRFDGKNK